ncbi:hypothetical protein [Nocardia sp. NPDC050406]|uniref:hypothetical protein n=1 Tax=Nocardia sp. NPDC050406 TaxID=3364318 RepID=UPI0037A04131
MRSKLSTRTAAVAVGAAAVLAAGLGSMAVASAAPALPPGPGGIVVGTDGPDRTIIHPEGPDRAIVTYRDGQVVEDGRVTIERDGERVIIHREGAPDVVGVPALPLPGLPGAQIQVHPALPR